MRSNGKLQLVYPQRFADGKLRPLSRSDRAAFRALAYASIDGEDLKRDPITAAKDFVSDLKVKLSRKK